MKSTEKVDCTDDSVELEFSFSTHWKHGDQLSCHFKFVIFVEKNCGYQLILALSLWSTLTFLLIYHDSWRWSAIKTLRPD